MQDCDRGRFLGWILDAVVNRERAIVRAEAASWTKNLSGGALLNDR